MLELNELQMAAVEKMKNGCLLVADVGTGKSRTSLAYYFFKVCQGRVRFNGSGEYSKPKYPLNLYIITTAKKRDSLEWERELSEFLLCSGENKEIGITVAIDSWNNIKKYTKVHGSFFIFDEQRVVGWGAWSKAFLDIARKNRWILLTATPGDTWSDYTPVFVANKFYKNKTDFNNQHVVFSRFSKYPKIERYVDQGILVKHRNDISVRMELETGNHKNVITVPCEYDKKLYYTVWKNRWDPFDSCPIEETGKLFYLLRKVVNSDESRLRAIERIADEHSKLIVFYNYTYELEVLRRTFSRLSFSIGEWNGEIHSEVPSGSRWAYLVQYSAGSEGWNCITTDTIIFFSQSYSYRMTVQAEGRIDRFNTPFKELYYFKLKSKAPIDLAIARALANKRNFNEKDFRG